MQLDDRPRRSKRTRENHPRSFALGFVDQGFSSATNLGLVLLAGRALGPSGLGAVALGIAAYLTCLGFQRALISEPLVARSSTVGSNGRPEWTNRALSVAIIAAATGATFLAAGGLVVGGGLGASLVLFAIWLTPALLQDFWRAVLFRDGRAVSATTNDGAWLFAMAAAAPAAWVIGTQWAVISCWGLGALVGAALGFVQTSARAARAAVAFAWWRRELWPFGRWLGAGSLVYASLSVVTAVALVAILGQHDYGGLQAVVTVYAPLSLIGPAIVLPGLPVVSRALASSESSARRLVHRLALSIAALTTLYVVLVNIGGGVVLTTLFGRSFESFKDIGWPIGIGQIAAGIGIAFGLLLMARRQGAAVFSAGTLGSATSLGLSSSLAALSGTVGAAWGLSAGSAVGAAATTTFALKRWPN